VAGTPTPMPGNYNAVGGFGMNPYDPRRDPRDGTADGRPALQTGGSSSGVGTAANWWQGMSARNVGINPQSGQSEYARRIKPTVGRISRYGVIPITADQDTAGPMAKSVTDIASCSVCSKALRLTQTIRPPKLARLPQAATILLLKADGLKGARIGIPRAFSMTKPRRQEAKEPRGGLNPDQAKVMTEAIGILKQQGPSLSIRPIFQASSARTEEQFPAVEHLRRRERCEGQGRRLLSSLEVRHETRLQQVAGLAGPGCAGEDAHRAAAVEHHAHQGRRNPIWPSNLDVSDEMDVQADGARYEIDRAKDIALGGTHGIDEAMKSNNLDALLLPGANGAAIAAKPGYPTVIVPFGTVPNAPTPAFPEGFNAKPAAAGRKLHGHGVQRPRLNRTGLRV